ncbi:hypothetical protein E1A91_D05G277200v1 [Gossypium mustelinum]|uniref:Gamma-butyrobetaine hydroxylase-like N-terminal domain-containing protein n=1 Tax=Gossypium mustelinum TaxID=34275 RepID=A0A5D2V1M0_GOSMU|nr:hypothetical protein E1A91_D05G277200v1 [Gossypium mustelinum]
MHVIERSSKLTLHKIDYRFPKKLQYGDIPEDIEPEEIQPMGNHAMSITWPDGFSQVAPYYQLQMIERLVDVPQPTAVQS